MVKDLRADIFEVYMKNKAFILFLDNSKDTSTVEMGDDERCLYHCASLNGGGYDIN